VNAAPRHPLFYVLVACGGVIVFGRSRVRDDGRPAAWANQLAKCGSWRKNCAVAACVAALVIWDSPVAWVQARR
jgi:hypothetical protein